MRATKILVVILLAAFGFSLSFTTSEATDTTPPDGGSISASPNPAKTDELVRIQVGANDAESDIKTIEIYVDDSLIKVCSNVQLCTHSAIFSAGTHPYYAKITSEGGTAQLPSTPKTFTVVDITPPDFITVSHSPRAPVTGQIVKLSAKATDAQSAVTKLEIYVDDVLKKTCSYGTCAYSSTHNIGDYQYYAKATSEGGTARSATGSFSVAQAQPTVIRSGQAAWFSQGYEYDLDADPPAINPDSGEDIRFDYRSPTERRVRAGLNSARIALTGVDANSDCTILAYSTDEGPAKIAKSTTWPANYYFCVRTKPSTDVFKYYLINYYAADSPPDTFDWQEHQQAPVCGDSVVQVGEECDDGNTDDSDACVGCQNAACGDGFLQDRIEQCDDGNTASGDGCSSACEIEQCGNGVVEGAEECDDGNTRNDDSCTNSCKSPACGDGFMQAGEDCDGTNLGGTTCSDLGFSRGTPTCDPNACTFDTTNCLPAECSNGETHTCAVTGKLGECAKGEATCNFAFWSACEQINQPVTEICNSLDDDCNGATDNGFDLQTDVSNCGVCGNACSFENAQASCTNAECALASCNENFWNLDGSSTNGCEFACTPTNSGVEICDGADNDCDGVVDVKLDASGVNEFDQDGDYWTTCGSNTLTGETARDTNDEPIADCDDDPTDDDAQLLDNPYRPAADAINPAALDPVWDGVDNNCDGMTDASITISEPLAGAEWLAGTPQLIRWTASNVRKFELTYSTDANPDCKGETIGTANAGCESGSWICLLSSITNEVSQTIIAPAVDSTSVRVRVEGHDDSGTVIGNACSDAFTIAPDSEPPTVSITSPQDGDTVSGTITITADASDNIAVSDVIFMVDTDVNSKSSDTSSPYTASLDTTTLTNGEHVVKAFAQDTAGNTQPTEITIIVDNAVAECTPDAIECTAAGSPIEAGKIKTCGVDGMWKTEVDCTTPEHVTNSYATCASGVCGFACQPGFVFDGEVCAASDITCSDNSIEYRVSEKICTTGTLKIKTCEDVSGTGTWSNEEACATDLNGATGCANGVCSLNCNSGYEFSLATESCELVSCTAADWACTDWLPDPCEAGSTQTRTCTHSVDCATDDAKPAISRDCVISLECTTDTDCAPAAHGDTACTSGACVTTCDTDYELQSGACVLKQAGCTKTPGQETRETSCEDSLDNDCDTKTDATDEDCTPAGQPACGNSVIEGTEECDEVDLAGKTCATYSANSKFTGGTLKCNPACKFDASGCVKEETKLFAGTVWDAGHEEVGELEAGSTVKDYKIKIKTRTENPTVTFRFRELRPATVPEISSAYKYFEVDTNIPEAAFDSATLNFVVDKSWIIDNKIDKEKIKLNRLEGSNWKVYESTIDSEVGVGITYKARLPGLSSFVIAGESLPAAKPAPKEETPVAYRGGGGFGTRATYGAGSALTQAIAAPVLGNSKCETGENSQNACMDCGCRSAAYECVSNKCTLTAQIDAGVVPESNVPETIVGQSSKLKLPWQANVLFAAVLLALIGVAVYRFYLKPRMLGSIAEAHDADEPGGLENAKSFIAHALAEGHIMSDIKTHLLESGWAHEDVEHAVGESAGDLEDLQNTAEQFGVHETSAAVSQLKAYVKAGLAKGYTEAQIRAVVLSNGWPEDVVDKVIR